MTDTITAPIITSPADWSHFWKRLLAEYDAILIEAHEREPGTATCTRCFRPFRAHHLHDGFCEDCLN